MKPEDLSPLSAEMKSLLGDERAAPGMPAAMQAGLASRIAKTIASPALPMGDDASSVADAADAATGLSPLASLAAKPALLAATAFGVGVGAGVSGSEIFRDDSVAPAAPVAIVEFVDAGVAVLPTPDAEVPVAAAKTDASLPILDASTPRKAGSMRRDQALAAERSLIELSRTALTRGNAANALKALKRHARKFRRGQLAEERDALWVQALALNPDTHAEARRRAESFLGKYPKSLFRPIIEHVLKKMR